ncbi:ATP-binding protein [Thermopirellula anaerolimosa]
MPTFVIIIEESSVADTTPETTDVSLEEQIRILQERLQRAERLTALGELVGTTTHEFNNVLTTILNWARHGLRHKDDATREKALETIISAANRGSRITQTILGLARNRSGELEPTDLRRLLTDTLLLLEREMNKYHVRVEVQMDAVPPVMADGNQIQQVLLNLLVNARQAMPRGGRLTIRLKHDPESQTVDLQVRDYGTGIPPEVLPRIFDPYFTTKRGPDASGKGGSGLGLSACRDIIEAHHGRIRVESALGKGTCFTIRLPVAKQAATYAPRDAGTESSPDSPDEKPKLRPSGRAAPAPPFSRSISPTQSPRSSCGET